MRRGKNSQQMALANVVEVVCKCGCKQRFFAAKTPRMREYLNNTHKKRGARARQKSIRENASAKLAPRGWVYTQFDNDEQRQNMWDHCDDVQRALITLMCDTGYATHEVLSAAQWLSDMVDIPF